ncbi:MFS general substrate transporter [Karstenula rhodostoma CBS 690.94]|uniref:MFS general substrate transporter n=1 Tax=Karstenula rhodostoma CBS 690.94 TaxID=1392251 RepID=A0A9P4P519_9PLEO|nr:MFS general substrate transporter [Karstenula rhodostoma CBS 690.94]
MTQVQDAAGHNNKEVAGPFTEWVQIPDNPDVGRRLPLHLVEERHAVEFHKRNQLPIEKHLFVRGVLALRSQDLIEPLLKKQVESHKNEPNAFNAIIRLKIGKHEYTKLETEILYHAWSRDRRQTIRSLSRGWDQAAMAGAAIEVMNNLGRPTHTGPSSGTTKRATDLNIDIDYNTWMLGFTVGAPFFAGAILGLIITDPITRFWGFGRRGAICVAGVFSLISVVGCASAHQWKHLLGFRILLGAGMAGKASIVPILLSETSPKNVRGILLVFWQLFVAFGLAVGSFANIIVYRIDVNSSWRYMFIAAVIPALFLISLILFSPESPRWLLKESGGQKQDEIGRQKLVQHAFLSLIDLRGEPVPIVAAGEIYLMHTRLIDEQYHLAKASSSAARLLPLPEDDSIPERRLCDQIQHIGWWPRVKLMFFHSGLMRRAHLAAFAVMISQQLCGINLLAFISDTFLRASIFHHNDATTPRQNMTLLGFSCMFMSLNFVTTIFVLPYIDKSNGRRRLLNISFPGMALSLLFAAIVLRSLHNPSTGIIAAYYIFLGLFTIAYSIGEGPAAFVISAEVFPLVNRELGMSLAVFWNFLGAGLLAVISPWLVKYLDQLGVLLLFSGLNLVAWFICYWLVPDTGNEDLEDVFAQLDITSGFLLIYTIKTLWRRATGLVEYCLHRGNKPWLVL